MFNAELVFSMSFWSLLDFWWTYCAFLLWNYFLGEKWEIFGLVAESPYLDFVKNLNNGSSRTILDSSFDSKKCSLNKGGQNQIFKIFSSFFTRKKNCSGKYIYNRHKIHYLFVLNTKNGSRVMVIGIFIWRYQCIITLSSRNAITLKLHSC